MGRTAAIVAALRPLVAGARAAVLTGRARDGARTGFWSGMLSGLIAFLVLGAAGLPAARFPSLPGVEAPRDSARSLTPEEWGSFDVGDYLAGGIIHLAIIGAAFCSAAGAIGGRGGPVAELTLLPVRTAVRTPKP